MVKFKTYLTESHANIFHSSISLQNYLEQFLKERMKGKKLKFMDIKLEVERNFLTYLKQKITNESLKLFYQNLGQSLYRAINNDVIERKDGSYIVK